MDGQRHSPEVDAAVHGERLGQDQVSRRQVEGAGPGCDRDPGGGGDGRAEKCHAACAARHVRADDDALTGIQGQAAGGADRQRAWFTVIVSPLSTLRFVVCAGVTAADTVTAPVTSSPICSVLAVMRLISAAVETQRQGRAREDICPTEVNPGSGREGTDRRVAVAGVDRPDHAVRVVKHQAVGRDEQRRTPPT